jgi:Type II secretion system (T2SS), protein M subtype b
MMLQGTALSKLLAVMLLAIPLGAVAFAGNFFWQQWKDQNSQIEAILDQYDHTRAVASFRADSLHSPRSDDWIKRASLGEGQPAVLMANLQSKIRELAVQKGVEILQAGDLKFDAQEDGFARLGVHIEMTGNQEGIVSVIAQVQQSEPWLFLDNVQLRSGYLSGASLAAEPPHFVSMDVWGIAPAETESLPKQ